MSQKHRYKQTRKYKDKQLSRKIRRLMTPEQRKAMEIDLSKWKKALKAASEAAAVAAYALSGLKLPFIDQAIDQAIKEQDEAHRAARNDFEVYRLGVWNDAPVLGIPLPPPDETFFYGPNGELLMKFDPIDFEKHWRRVPTDEEMQSLKDDADDEMVVRRGWNRPDADELYNDLKPM